MNTRSLGSSFLIRIILYLWSVGCVYPVLFTIFTSLKDNREFYSNIWSFPSRIKFENYVDAFHIGRMGEYFINSIIIALISLISVTVIAMFAAYALAKLKIPYAAAIVGLLFVIQILPVESMIIPLYIQSSRLHMFAVPYLPIAVVYIGWLLPMTIIILRNFILSIPSELIEAAKIDGCSEMSTMFRVVFPLTGGAIATCTILNFGFVWGELMWAQLATLNTDKGIPLSVGLINFQGQYTTNWGTLTAAMCMVIVPLLVLFIFMQKYFIQGLTSGAIKG